MQSVIKSFSTETFTYIVDRSPKSIIEQLDILFVERAGLLRYPNLKGDFVDYPQTFYITQKWWFGHTSGTDNQPAMLKGVVFELDDKTTKIEIAVKSNAIFVFFSILFTLVGFLLLCKGILDNASAYFLGAIFLFVFVIPILFLSSRIASNRLRILFENYMEI
jgi:hypothetical protein